MILLQHGGTLTTLARTFILNILIFCFEHIISLVKPLKKAGKKVPNQEACIEDFFRRPLPCNWEKIQFAIRILTIRHRKSSIVTLW